MRLLLLLVCAVGLLLRSATVGSDVPKKFARIKLNYVYDLSERCTASPSGTFFVEDVSHLVEGINKCEDKFFCKVQEILANLNHFCKNSEMLVRTLGTYNNHRNVNCTEAVQGVTRTGNEITVSDLLTKLRRCIQHRNFRGAK